MMLEPEQIRARLHSRTRQVVTNPSLRRAGVLMLLFPHDGETHLLLTKRTSDVEHHKGQISFPGGSVDEGDADIVATAIREAEEEVGIGRHTLEVLGLFDDFWTPSGFGITPVVAACPSIPPMNPFAPEVAEILQVPISFFLNKENERMERIERGGTTVDLYSYRYGDHQIWGATAAIIRSFLHEVVTQANGRY